MSLEDKVQANTDMMKDLLSQMRGSGGVSPGGGGISSGLLGSFTQGVKGVVGGLENVATELGTFTGKLVRNNAQIPDVANVLKTAAGEFGGFGRLFGDTAGGIINYMDESVKNYQAFSNFGITMSGNAERINLAMGLTRLTAEEFAENYKLLDGFTSSMGRTVSEGVMHYAQFSDAFQSSGANERLRQLGFNFKTTNELLTLYTRTRADLDMRDATVRAKAIEDIEKFGQRMAEVTARTGITRQEQLDQTKILQENPAYMGRLLRAKQEGDDSFGTRSQELINSVGFASGSKLLTTAIKESLGNGGMMEPETLNLMSQAFPRLTQQIQEMGATFEYASDEERQRIIQRIQSGEMEETYREEINEGQLATLVSTRGVLSEAQRAELMADKIVKTEIFGSRYQKSVGLDPNQSAKESKYAAGLDLGGFTLETNPATGDREGQRSAGAETTRLILNTQARLKDLGTVTNEYVDKLNTELGMGVSSIRTLNMQPILRNGGVFKALIANKLDPGKMKDMDPEDAKNYIMNLLEDAMNEVSSKKAGSAEKKAGGGPFGSGFKIVGEIGPELVKMQSPGDMLTALDTKNLASDMKNGMSTVLPMLNMLREIPQTISNAVDTASNSDTVPSVQVGQDDSVEILKQISTKMEQFVMVAGQIASYSEKTARNTDDLGDSVYS